MSQRIGKLGLILLTSPMRGYCWGCKLEALHRKAPSFTTHINLCQNQGDAGLKTGADGTSNITKHDELHIH
jgi:hypothetical protein